MWAAVGVGSAIGAALQGGATGEAVGDGEPVHGHARRGLDGQPDRLVVAEPVRLDPVVLAVRRARLVVPLAIRAQYQAVPLDGVLVVAAPLHGDGVRAVVDVALGNRRDGDLGDAGVDARGRVGHAGHVASPWRLVSWARSCSSSMSADASSALTACVSWKRTAQRRASESRSRVTSRSSAAILSALASSARRLSIWSAAAASDAQTRRYAPRAYSIVDSRSGQESPSNSSMYSASWAAWNLATHPATAFESWSRSARTAVRSCSAALQQARASSRSCSTRRSWAEVDSPPGRSKLAISTAISDGFRLGSSSALTSHVPGGWRCAGRSAGPTSTTTRRSGPAAARRRSRPAARRVGRCGPRPRRPHRSGWRCTRRGVAQPGRAASGRCSWQPHVQSLAGAVGAALYADLDEVGLAIAAVAEQRLV